MGRLAIEAVFLAYEETRLLSKLSKLNTNITKQINMVTIGHNTHGKSLRLL